MVPLSTKHVKSGCFMLGSLWRVNTEDKSSSPNLVRYFFYLWVYFMVVSFPLLVVFYNRGRVFSDLSFFERSPGQNFPIHHEELCCEIILRSNGWINKSLLVLFTDETSDKKYKKLYEKEVSRINRKSKWKLK